MKTKDLHFRELEGEVCYIEKDDSLEKALAPFDDAQDSTGFLGYGFVDYEKGVCFEVLCRAKKEDDDFQTLPTQYSTSVQISMADILENEIEILEVNEKIYDKKIKKIKDHTPSAVKEIRELDFLDDCRDEIFPDVFNVHFGEELRLVKVTRLNDVDGCLEGVLLDEPSQTIQFALKKQEDETLICFKL